MQATGSCGPSVLAQAMQGTSSEIKVCKIPYKCSKPDLDKVGDDAGQRSNIRAHIQGVDDKGAQLPC